MAKEIQKLTSLVLDGCCSPQPPDGTPGAFDIRYREILHEVHYLRHRLPVRMSGLGKRKACNMYTRQFQATLIVLMDALYEVNIEEVRMLVAQVGVLQERVDEVFKAAMISYGQSVIPAEIPGQRMQLFL